MRGFTLLEVTVAGVLLFLLLTILVQILIPLGKGSVRASQQASMQQSALLAQERLGRDLVQTVPSAVHVFSPSGGLQVCLHPLTSVGAGGTQVFAAAAAFYFWDGQSRRLQRKTWPPAPPNLTHALSITSPFVPLDAESALICQGANGTERLLASDVEEFTLSLQGLTVRVHLLLRSTAPDGLASENYALDRVFYLPNENS